MLSGVRDVARTSGSLARLAPPILALEPRRKSNDFALGGLGIALGIIRNVPNVRSLWRARIVAPRGYASGIIRLDCTLVE